MHFVISQELLIALVRYLGRLPHDDVAPFIQELAKLPQFQKADDIKDDWKVTEKK